MRPLFAKDKSGNLVRNYYCLECSVGPFNQADIDSHILIESGMGRQTAHYCRICSTLKLPKMVLPTLDESMKAREAFILSGKAMEDISSIKTKASPVVATKIKKVYEKPVIKEVTDPAVISELIKEPVAIMLPDVQKKSEEDTKQLIAEIIEEQDNPRNRVNLKNMTGPAIICFVQKKTGNLIKTSPKSKKSVLKQAKQMLEEKGLKVFF